MNELACQIRSDILFAKNQYMKSLFAIDIAYKLKRKYKHNSTTPNGKLPERPKPI